MAQDTLAQIPIRTVATADAYVPEKITEEPVKVSKVQTGNTADENKREALIKFSWVARLVVVLLLIMFVAIGATYFWAITSDGVPKWLAPVMTAMWVLSGSGVVALLYWMWKQFSRFSNDLSIWANELLQGDFASRMPVRTERCPSKGIREHINKIAEDYEKLSHYQQQRLTRQSKRIEQKKYYLGVLYDVASSINRSNNLEDLLQRFLHTLTNVVKAEAATVRLLDKNDEMRLVASIGLSDEIIKSEDTLPAPDCLCGKALTDSSVIANSALNHCSLMEDSNYFNRDEDIEMLAIPLQYRGKTLGVYNLFVQRKEHDILEGEHELLVSIGQHLGMAIEQSGVEEDARTLSIIEERTRMAHELHDSLAQTLASLRYKVRLFDDSLNQGDEEVIWHELEGLEKTIDHAYAELRSLITDFRAPIDGKGIIRAVKRMAERFKQDNDIDVFYYHNWDLLELPRSTEIEVIRIIQEALTNIQKHANANSIRILMTSTEEGNCSVLVEDDGSGLKNNFQKTNKETGEHIGLSIMKERAKRINGEIHFESDAGEGTLVQLNFEIAVDNNSVTLNTFN